jgi:hypothetical protein
MIKNGGLLFKVALLRVLLIVDQVVFVIETEDPKEISWIKNVVKDHPEDYESIDSVDKSPFEWVSDDTLLLTLNDNTLFIKKEAIEWMAQEYISGRWWLVSANVINHPQLASVHAHLGALYNFKNRKNQYQLEGSALHNLELQIASECSLLDESCAYDQHLSFFKNYHDGNLKSYNFHLWDFHAFVRLKIQTNQQNYKSFATSFVMMNSTIGHLLNRAHDQHMSLDLPKTHQKHSAAIGDSLVAQFLQESQNANPNGRTDVISGYRLIAKKECRPQFQKYLN